MTVVAEPVETVTVTVAAKSVQEYIDELPTWPDGTRL